MFSKSCIFALTGGISLACGGIAQAQLSAYQQNFETLDRANPDALTNDGYDLFVNVFDSTGTVIQYGYGPFDAPNNINNPNISVISESSQAPVGAQGLVILSDYNNSGAQTAGNRIEVNVFQQQTIGANDIGDTYRFTFTAAPVLNDSGENVLLGTDTTTQAFIKTLDPASGFATTNFITQDTTFLTAGNTTFTLDIDLSDPLLAGQLLQFGFANTASNYEPSGVNYDDVSFAIVPEPASLAMLGIGGLLLIQRRGRD